MDSQVREKLYFNDLKRAAAMTPGQRIKEALELSNLCLKLSRRELTSPKRSSRKSQRKNLGKT